jgi:hypothetical protein
MADVTLDDIKNLSNDAKTNSYNMLKLGIENQTTFTTTGTYTQIGSGAAKLPGKVEYPQ